MVLAEHAELRQTDLPPGGVVSDHHHHRHLETHRGLEVEAVEAERAVALDHEDGALRMQVLGGEPERRAHAQAAQRPGVEPAAGPGEFDGLGAHGDKVPAVGDEHRVAGPPGGLGDLLRDPEVVQRRLVAPQKRREPVDLLQFARSQVVEQTVPGLGGHCLAELLEHRARVADDAGVDPPVATDLRRIHVHLDERGLGRDGFGRAVAEPEVQGRAHHQDDVGAGQRFLARLLEEVGMAGRKRPARGAVEIGRQAGPLDQQTKLLGRVVEPNRAAGDDGRTLSAVEGSRGLSDQHRVAGRASLGAIPGRQAGLGLGSIQRVDQLVEGDLQEDRPRPARERHPEGPRQVRRNGLRRGNAIGPFGDAQEQIDLLDLLQRPLAGIESRGRAADEQERRVGGEGVGDPGQRVGNARPGGDHRDSKAARETRVGIGGVGGALLVPGVDDPDAYIDAAGVDRSDVQPGEREDRGDLLAREHPGDQFAAGDRGHGRRSNRPVAALSRLMGRHLPVESRGATAESTPSSLFCDPVATS